MVDENLHEKLHSQQELIEKLKTDLCNANITWNEKVRAIESELNFERGQRKNLEENLSRLERETKNTNIQLKQNIGKLENVSDKNNILVIKLKNREKEIEILNRTIEQMQEEIRRALKGSNPGSGDWELETLRKMANKLSRESRNLHDFDGGIWSGFD